MFNGIMHFRIIIILRIIRFPSFLQSDHSREFFKEFSRHVVFFYEFKVDRFLTMIYLHI